MHKLQSAIIAVLLGATSIVALSSPSLAQSCTCAGAGIRADIKPPPLPNYDQPPIPAPGYMWTPGYWAWNNYDYYWVPGTWVEPPQEGLLWTPGYWGYDGGAYVYNRGYWGPHVGFYGGVSYGFGYDGAGYEGGRWDHGQFFYNRSVNNIGSVHVTDVYEKTVVINNVTANRASFNGPGGTEAKPTAEEEADRKETHVPPTDSQVQHARTASMKSDLFESTNHGRPAIAATVRPAAFTGPGVVKAKPNGVAPVHPVSVTPNGVEPEKKPETGQQKLERDQEKRAPGTGKLEATPRPSQKVEPEGAARRPVGEPEKKAQPTATPSPKIEPQRAERRPAGEPEKKVEPERKASPAPVERKAPPVGAANEHAPPAARPVKPAPLGQPNKGPGKPEKEKCGNPGQPKCP